MVNVKDSPLVFKNRITFAYYFIIMKKINLLLVLSLFLYSGIGFAQSADKSKLNDLLMLKSDMVQKNEIEHRYVIQLGSYSQMTEAEEALKTFKQSHPDWPARLEYESPNYKVWIGSFTSRLSAERLYVNVKKEFKSAFVLKPR